MQNYFRITTNYYSASNSFEHLLFAHRGIQMVSRRAFRRTIIPKWICVVSKVYGFWPYPIHVDVDQNVESGSMLWTCVNLLWSTMAILIYILCAYCHYVRVFYELSDIYLRVVALIDMSFSCVAVLMVLMTMRRRNAFAKLIEIVRLVDREVGIFLANCILINKDFIFCSSFSFAMSSATSTSVKNSKNIPFGASR